MEQPPEIALRPEREIPPEGLKGLEGLTILPEGPRGLEGRTGPGPNPTRGVKSERTDTPPGREETTARTEHLQERAEVILSADRILGEVDLSPHQDREEESRADLLTGSREAPPSTLREDPEEMITLDQEEGKGAS